MPQKHEMHVLLVKPVRSTEGVSGMYQENLLQTLKITSSGSKGFTKHKLDDSEWGFLAFFNSLEAAATLNPDA